MPAMAYERGVTVEPPAEGETEAFRDHLRDLALIRLNLYLREIGDEFFAKLVANRANWRAGYVPAHDCYWCTPRTADGNYLVGPFTAIKWTKQELKMLGVLAEDA